jgi:drug/metabolite transporter (DMT)-like permease
LPIRAFLLVLAAAIGHATWNFLAKRFAHHEHLIWLASVMEALLFAPMAVWIVSRHGLPFSAAAFLALLATGVLHVLYTECLVRGYRAGDFTIVYPVARGSAPLLSFAGALIFLREPASAIAICGALLISLGILVSSGIISGMQRTLSRVSLLWGAATGLTIACYTIVDAYSVTQLMIAPLIVEYAESLCRSLALSPKAWGQRALLPREFSQCWTGALGIALLMPLSYIMVLSAMKLAPVSHVAPVREMSMMIGMYFGAKFLAEGHLLRKSIGSALIAGGVAAIALG